MGGAGADRRAGLAVERAAPGLAVMSTPDLRSCSYQGQDLFVVEALGGLRGGFFLDSGASDGVSGSNTLLLEAGYGWRGICVEPNEQLFARLSRSRQAVCVNCCLYDRPGEVSFLEGAGVFGGILDEYDPAMLRYARSLVAASGGAVTKPARTIGSVLREVGAPRVIDYWSLDTEGSELAILRSFPFEEHPVRVLTVEHNGTPARDEIRHVLEAEATQDLREPLVDLRRAHPLPLEAEGHVLAHAQVGPQGAFLEDDAHRALARRQCGHVLPVDDHAAGRERHEPGDRAQERRLPRMRRAEHREELAIAHVQ